MNDYRMTQNRKRSRNIHDDDTSEFMPLSKRINNLHINNAFQVIASPTQTVNMLLKPTQWGPGPPGFGADPLSAETPDVHSPGWNKPHYNPILNETQNPYYYNNNKLLFELFVERMQRNGHSFH